MKRYVNGFMFDWFFQSVMLLQKQHPAWQKGLWNGVGGKIEEDETPVEAMVREFREETGIDTNPGEWEHQITLSNDHFEVYFFRARSDKIHAWDGTSPTDETVSLWDIPRIQEETQKIHNLSWVIPLLLDPDLEGPIEIRHM